MDFWYPGDIIIIQIYFNCTSLSEGEETVRGKGNSNSNSNNNNNNNESPP